MIPAPIGFFRRAGSVAPTEPAFLQAVYTDSIVVTTELPVDDTIPQVSEGQQILSLTTTPMSSSSRFLIEAAVFASPKFALEVGPPPEFDLVGAVETRAWAAAIFRGSTCIQVHGVDGYLTDDHCGNLLRMSILDAPATASPLTWSVRVGPSRLNQIGSPSDPGLGLRINGVYTSEVVTGSPEESSVRNGRLFGGAAKCTLTLQELP